MSATNKYYTNVHRQGNWICLREIEDGKRKKRRTEYHPTLYVPSNKASKFTATDGTPVGIMRPGKMGDCYQFVQKYKDIEGFRIYGNTEYTYAFINEFYPGKIEAKISDLVIANLDIEVARSATHGYSEAKDASNEVIAITVKVRETFHVFACKPFENTFGAEVEYYHCDDEIDLLEQFLRLWEAIEPDIVTGWNCRYYDIPYLVNRLSLLMSKEASLRLSPWKSIREASDKNKFGGIDLYYEIAGVSVLDYLRIYKKNVPEPRENYTLDYIAQVELKEQKVDYGEYKNLQDLYERNFQKFIEYNIHDVRLVDRIDAKKNLLRLQIEVAYHAKVNYEDVYGPVRTWDTNICNHLLAKNVVVPLKEHVDKKAQFTGAYVMTPIPGMYHWIASYDVQSLYPTIMRILNMGMETKVPYNEWSLEMRQYATYIKSNLYTKAEDGKKLVKPEAILQGLTPALMAHFREQNVTVGANGVYYRRAEKSFYSVMIEELVDNRNLYKGELKKAKKLKELYLRKRDLEVSIDVARSVAASGQPQTFDIDQLRLEYDAAEKELLSACYKTIEECGDAESTYDLKQYAMKILLNSLYGALGNGGFRFFDIDNAEAVTTTGQFIIQYIGRGIDAFLNRLMQTTGVRYVIYSDTDSCAQDTVIAINGKEMEIQTFYDLATGTELPRDNGQWIKELTDNYTTHCSDGVEILDRRVKYVMKHEVEKEMFEIEVDGNVVVVTEDHCLVVKRKNSLIEVKPAQILPGDQLITKTPIGVPAYEKKETKC